MAIDTAAKRRSAATVATPWMAPGVTPDAAKPVAWRQQSGWGYSGIPAATPTVTPTKRITLYWQRDVHVAQWARTAYTLEWDRTRYSVEWSRTMSLIRDLECDKGEALSITCPVRGTAVAITGWTIQMDVSLPTEDDVDSDPLLTLTSPSGGIALTTPTAGLFTITVTSAQTLALGAGIFSYCVMRSDAGYEATLVKGTLTIHPVARW